MSQTLRNIHRLVNDLWSPASLRSFAVLPLVVVFIALTAVVASGVVRRRARAVEPLLLASVAYTSALLALSVLSLILGEIRLAYLAVFISVMVVVIVAEAVFVARSLKPSFASVRSSIGAIRDSGDALWLLLIVAVFAALFVVAARPPVFIDEVQYHWAAPVYWAAHHGLVRSPYKFTNGPSLMEITYLLPALARASTLAHWITVAFAGSLCLSVAALGQRLGFRPVVGAAVVVSIPSLLILAPVAQTDVPLAALLGMALCALVIPEDHRSWDLVAGAFLAAAYSVKSLLAVAEAVPLVLIVMVIRYVTTPHEDAATPQRGVIAWTVMTVRAAVRIGSIPAAVVVLWAAHTWLLIHRLFESSSGFTIVHTNDPSLAAGGATGRLPSIVDVVTLPLLPLRVAVLGVREPYGGRSGYLPLLFVVVAALWCARRLFKHPAPDPIDYRRAVIICVSILAWLCVVASVFAKTRFLYLQYALLGAMATAFVLPVIKRRTVDRVGRLLAALVVVLVLAGIADGLHASVRPVVAEGARPTGNR